MGILILAFCSFIFGFGIGYYGYAECPVCELREASKIKAMREARKREETKQLIQEAILEMQEPV